MSKRKNNFYAILAGGEKKIFTTWDDCQKFRDAHPSNAQYKGFSSREGAEAFLASLGSEPSHQQSEIASNPVNNPEAYPDNGAPKTPVKEVATAIVYSDGSYNEAAGIWGYGALLFPINSPKKLRYYSGSGKDGISSRNVAGELHGAVRAIQEAISLGYKKVIVRYDYAGIEMWAINCWKAKTPLTSWYKSEIEKLRKRIAISFEKVAAHTGEQYNELVDGIAKRTAGI